MSIIKVDKITQLSDSVMNEETGDITITRKFPITLAEAVICDFDGDPETVNENLLQALEKRNVGIVTDESGKTTFVDMDGNEVLARTTLSNIYIDKDAGVVMSDLNVGDINTPVYIENGIPKACSGETSVQGLQGIQGVQGAQGLQGIQGAQGLQGIQGAQGVQGFTGKIGSQGVKGTQGNTGLRGVQGETGLQGVQGVQGRTGSKGVSGNKGLQGVQGAQGSQGSSGIQGTSGCRGYQGKTGMTGVQGVQGKKGLQGTRGQLGYQGNSGIQGAQGIQGGVGSRGYLGYQGQDGEVGIQGVTGEHGSVWVDGIRLDGYNTHLFTYDSVANKFIPKNNPEDLLYIRNGAVIKIWMNQDAYDAISVDGHIHIDRLENGVRIATSYPVYYSGTTPMMSVVNPINDIDTVIEFTYRDEAWYYSGGLLTPTITEDIIVTGVELGQLHEGALVEAGTTIQELFQRLLVKEIDVHGVNPKLSINVVSGDLVNNKIYEVGSTVASVLGTTYTDGRFVGDEGYTYDINAGCPDGAATYKQNGVTMASANISIENIGEESITFNANASYGSSTVVPRTNVGNVSSVSIDGGNVSTGNITIHGRYKMYYGKQSATTASTVDDPTTYQFTDQSDLSALTEGWLQKDSSTTISMISSTSELPSFVIVIPEDWDIESTNNSFGQSVDINTTWYKQNKIAYNNNGVQTWYQVYVSPSTEATSYKDIVLNK